ncbi:hypothetical protein ACFL2K_01510 [Candidatus Margulisiibacteriota bacterium]
MNFNPYILNPNFQQTFIPMPQPKQNDFFSQINLYMKKLQASPKNFSKNLDAISKLLDLHKINKIPSSINHYHPKDNEINFQDIGKFYYDLFNAINNYITKIELNNKLVPNILNSLNSILKNITLFKFQNYYKDLDENKNNLNPNNYAAKSFLKIIRKETSKIYISLLKTCQKDTFSIICKNILYSKIRFKNKDLLWKIIFTHKSFLENENELRRIFSDKFPKSKNTNKIISKTQKTMKISEDNKKIEKFVKLFNKLLISENKKLEKSYKNKSKLLLSKINSFKQKLIKINSKLSELNSGKKKQDNTNKVLNNTITKKEQQIKKLNEKFKDSQSELKNQIENFNELKNEQSKKNTELANLLVKFEKSFNNQEKTIKKKVSKKIKDLKKRLYKVNNSIKKFQNKNKIKKKPKKIIPKSPKNIKPKIIKQSNLKKFQTWAKNIIIKYRNQSNIQYYDKKNLVSILIEISNNKKINAKLKKNKINGQREIIKALIVSAQYLLKSKITGLNNVITLLNQALALTKGLKSDLLTAECNYWLGSVYFDKIELLKANKHLNKVIEKDLQHQNVCKFKKLKSTIAKKEYKKIIKLTNKIETSKGKEKIEALYDRIFVYELINLKEKMLTEINLLLKENINPEMKPKLLMKKGDLLLYKNKSNEAKKSYFAGTCLKDKFLKATFSIRLARVYRYLGKNKLILSSLKKAQENYPDNKLDPKSKIIKLALLVYLQNYKQALNLYEKELINQKLSLDDYHNVMNAYLGLNEFEKCIELCEKVKETNKSEIKANNLNEYYFYTFYANAYFHNENYQKALEQYNYCIGIDLNNIIVNNQTEIKKIQKIIFTNYYNRTFCEFQLGNRNAKRHALDAVKYAKKIKSKEQMNKANSLLKKIIQNKKKKK